VSRASQCIVGIQEDWTSTLAVMEHWFPWMGNLERDHRRLFARNAEKPNDLPASHIEIIERYNPCDIHLYDSVTAIFNKQLQVLNDPAFI
jgi:hypothetical protein